MDLRTRQWLPAWIALYAGCGGVDPGPRAHAECAVESKRLVLTVPALAFDDEAGLTVTGATPGARVSFFWTTALQDECGCPEEADGCIQLAEPEHIGDTEADDDGRATLRFPIPPDAPVGERRIQAVQDGFASEALTVVVSGELERDLELLDAEYAATGLGVGPNAAVVGDADEDGWIEVVTATPELGRVTVLEPAAAPRLPTGPQAVDALEAIVLLGPSSAGAGLAGLDDVTGDARPDLVIGAPAQGRVWLVPGGLAPGEHDLDDVAVDSFTGWTAGADLAVADLDGDWADDVAIAGGDRVWISLGGDLTPEIELPGLTLPELAEAGDLDADGLEDLVIGSADEVILYFGPGIQELGPLIEDVHVAAGGDLDGDGYDDVLAASPSALDGRGTVSLLRGPLSPPVPVLEGSEPGEQLGIELTVAGDVDGDGTAELVAAAADGSVALLYGPPGGTRSSAQADVRLEGATRAALTGPGDLDGDGYDDLLVTTRGESLEGSLWVFRGAPGW